MAQEEQRNYDISARAYPLRNPSGSTVAFANVNIENLVAINGIRIISGQNGLFVSMPQQKDAQGEYRDIAFPVAPGLRGQVNAAVLDAYGAELEKSAQERAAETVEQPTEPSPKEKGKSSPER